ncbi:MAG: glycosyltransferase family 4 protein [Deltaproteobacteria bacterium]|nr:glycosyltransferase family 4 protein [Deltaproteobacteria bacterium]
MAAHRILFVDHAPALGGAQVGLLLCCELIERAQFVPHLATQPGALAESARALGVTVHELPLVQLRGTLAGAAALRRGTAAVMRIVRAHDIALVYSNTVRASAYAALAARLTRRPLIWHVHDILRPGLYVRAMSALAAATIAVSQAAARVLPNRQRVRVIPQGVRQGEQIDEHEHRQAAIRLRAAWGVPPQAPLVGQVARLQPWKGQRDVIAAAAYLLRNVPAAHFVLVGGDIFDDAAAYERELHTLIAQSGLRAQVHLVAHQADVAAVFAAIDVLVHASFEEPFGRVLIEAGAAGVPVVAYGGGGVREILAHEHTALIVPPGDRAGLAAALHRVLGDRALATRLGTAARSEVAARFDVRRLTRDVEDVLRRALPRARH